MTTTELTYMLLSHACSLSISLQAKMVLLGSRATIRLHRALATLSIIYYHNLIYSTFININNRRE